MFQTHGDTDEKRKAAWKYAVHAKALAMGTTTQALMKSLQSVTVVPSKIVAKRKFRGVTILRGKFMAQAAFPDGTANRYIGTYASQAEAAEAVAVEVRKLSPETPHTQHRHTHNQRHAHTTQTTQAHAHIRLCWHIGLACTVVCA